MKLYYIHVNLCFAVTIGVHYDFALVSGGLFSTIYYNYN